MAVRQATKIKTAGDTAVDYPVTDGKFAVVEVDAHSVADRDGTGVILIEAPDIEAQFIYDADRVEYKILDELSPPEGARIFDDGNFIFTPEKISNDRGVTWVEPRMPGGRWILGSRVYSSVIDAILFEYRGPLGGIAYIADRATLEVTTTLTASAANLAYLDLSFETYDVSMIAVGGMTGQTDEGMKIHIGVDMYYITSDFGISDVNLTRCGTPSNYEIKKSDLMVGNTNSSYTSNYYCIWTINNAGRVDKWGWASWGTVSGSMSYVDIASNYLTYKASQIFLYYGDAGGADSALNILLDYHPNGHSIASIYAGTLYAVTYAAICYASNYGDVSATLPRDATMLAGWSEASDSLHFATEDANYTASTITGSWTETKYPTTETAITALTKAFGFSGEQYDKESSWGGTDYLGNVLADMPTRTAMGAAYKVSTQGAILPNTQIKLPFVIPKADVKIPPVVIQGIMCNGGDKVRVVGDVDFNFDVIGVEQ